MNLKKVLLGAASFGNTYGVANASVVNTSEIIEILHWAAKNGIYGIDTAPHYGNSEVEIGSSNERRLKVFTKFSSTRHLEETIRDSLFKSLQRLRRKRLNGLTIWSSQYLLNCEKHALSEVGQLRDEGLIQTWGVSVYEPQELLRILQVCQPDYVQFPLNLFDNRFLESGLVGELNSRKIEIHIRSIFLQGLLTMNSNEVPKSFAQYSQYFELIRRLSSEADVSTYDLSLSWAYSAIPSARLVIGVNSLSHLSRLSKEVVPLSDAIKLRIRELKVPLALSDPRMWTGKRT